VINAWTPGSKTLSVIGKSRGSKFDGVEILLGGRVLVASQKDSSLHLLQVAQSSVPVARPPISQSTPNGTVWPCRS
ncbi:MAG: hypothetical protein ACJ791_01675, partial [Gemmatimonadaceae bacterium]